MNAIIGVFGMVMVGWTSPDLVEPALSMQEKLPVQPTYSRQATPQPSAARPAQGMNVGPRLRPRMPLPPTDPRACMGGEIPLPPTMNENGAAQSAMRAGPEARFVSTGLAENGTRHSLNNQQKPYSQYNSGPAVSPYTLLNASTADGTVNTYMAYVRPAQDMERANQEMDQAASASDQPLPTYPRVFQNYGTYYPNYSAGR